jgi:hypothetical protein
MKSRVYSMSIAIALSLAVLPAVALGQDQQPAQGERQNQPQNSPETQEEAERQRSPQQQATNQQQSGRSGISMEGTLQSVDSEQMTLLVAVDLDSIMASEGESLENVPGLGRGPQAESDQTADGEDRTQRSETGQQQAETGQGQAEAGQQAEVGQEQPGQQASNRDTGSPLLLFHYNDQTEVVGDIQNIAGLAGESGVRVHIQYRAEGNQAIAERIEVTNGPQETSPEDANADERELGNEERDEVPNQ